MGRERERRRGVGEKGRKGKREKKREKEIEIEIDFNKQTGLGCQGPVDRFVRSGTQKRLAVGRRDAPQFGGGTQKSSGSAAEPPVLLP